MARRGGIRLMRTSLQSAGRWCHQAASWRHSTSAADRAFFENIAAIQMMVVIIMVVDRSMDRSNLLLVGCQSAAQDSVPRIGYHSGSPSRITQHAPGARRFVSIGGWINIRTGSPKAEGIVPETGAWTGFVSKTPAVRHFGIDFFCEKTDRHTLPDHCRVSWGCGSELEWEFFEY